MTTCHASPALFRSTPGYGCAHVAHGALQHQRKFSGARGGCGLDRQHRLPAFGRALPDDQIRLRAAHHREVRVARAFGRLEIPEHGNLGVHALDKVIDLPVGVGVQVAVGLDIIAEVARIALQLRHLLELRGRDFGRPAPRAQDANVPRKFEDLAGEALPLHKVDQVRGDVDEPLPLLQHVEEPRRPLDRRTGNELGEMVDAFFRDGRIVLGPLQQLAEYVRNARERLLQHRGDLVALGHDVVEQNAFFAGKRECLQQRLESSGVDGHRLVGQHVHARTDGAGQILGLAPVVAGDDGYIAGPIRAESVQEIRTGMNYHSPGRRIDRPRVVAFDLLQIVAQVRTVLGIDMHRRVHIGVHGLLQQRRVEMPRVEDDELHRWFHLELTLRCR